MKCNKCGGKFVPAPHGLDTRRTPDLIPLMLACEDCGRPLRILHKTGVPTREITKADRNRALRAARRKTMAWRS
jgi:hypothetical protein